MPAAGHHRIGHRHRLDLATLAAGVSGQHRMEWHFAIRRQRFVPRGQGALKLSPFQPVRCQGSQTKS
jgi:hypothetical protein